MKNNKTILFSKYIGGFIIIIAGIAIMFMGNAITNPFIIVLGLGIAAAGGYLVKSSISRGERRPDTSKKSKQELKDNPPNSVIIRHDSIKFENVYDPPGQSRKCFNDGEYYKLLKEQGGKIAPFILPDSEEEEIHYDPAEFGNVVTMPLNRKYFSWTDNLFQKISLAIMAVIIGAELITLIVFAG